MHIEKRVVNYRLHTLPSAGISLYTLSSHPLGWGGRTQFDFS